MITSTLQERTRTWLRHLIRENLLTADEAPRIEAEILENRALHVLARKVKAWLYIEDLIGAPPSRTYVEHSLRWYRRQLSKS